VRDHLLKKNEKIKGIKAEYKIVSVISSGGTAVTYKAIDSYGIYYCVKELYPLKLANNIHRDFKGLQFADSLSLASEEAKIMYDRYKEIFKREETITKNIQKIQKEKNNDYSILGLYESFEFKGFLYNVYQTAGCSTLLDYVKESEKEPLSIEKFKNYLKIISKILSALEDFHKKNTLHLDLALDNILVMSESQETIRLIDFGSALENYDKAAKDYKRIFFSSKDGYSSLELVEFAKNNTEFVARLTPATDIYSVAAILFRVLVGRTIECSDYLVDDWKKLIQKKLPIESSSRYNIMSNLFSIIECGLNNDMNSRYQTAAEMKAAIDNLHSELDKVDIRIKEEKNSKKAIKRGIGFIAAFLLATLLFLRFVTFAPNITAKKAYKEIEKGNSQKAYEILLDIVDDFNPFWHPCFSEEDLKSLAWAIYSDNSIASLEYDEPVIQAALTEDNEIVALLNNKITVRNLSLKEERLKKTIPVINSNGIISWNGKYYASLDNSARLHIYYMDSIASNPILQYDDVLNYSFDEIGNSLIFVDKENTVNIVDLITQEVSQISLGHNYAKKYVRDNKTLDYNTGSNRIAFINTDGEATVVDVVNNKLYTHVPTEGDLKFIQLSADSSLYPVVQLSNLKTSTFEYDYLNNDVALALSPLRYNYFISPDSNWKILWNFSSSLKDKILSINGNCVTLELCASNAKNHMRIMPNKGNSFNEEYFKLFDICDIEQNYFFDFDNQEKKLYRTHINEPVEQTLPVICDFDLNNVSTLYVHDNNVMIKGNNRIAFFKIEDNTVILNGEPIVLPQKPIFAGTPDKKTFAYTDKDDIIIYKYDNNKWGLFDKIPLRNGDDKLHLFLFNDDGTRFCVEYANHNKEVTTIDIYNLFGKCNLDETKEIKEILFDTIANDLEHGFAFYAKPNSPLEKVMVYNYLTDAKTDLDIKDTSKENLIRGTELVIKNHIITNRFEVDNPQHIKTYDNEKEIIRGFYTVSNVIKTTESQICFVARKNNNDYLMTYDVVSEKSVKKPLSNHMFDQLPIQYDLMYIDDNFTAISAIYNGAVLNTLHQDLTLDQLLKECEYLYN